jgi:hypothetical protein
MARLIIFTLLFFLSDVALSQMVDSVKSLDIVDVLLGSKKSEATKKKRSDRKVFFSIFPSAVSTPGGGRALITAINAAFYLGDPKTTNLSNVYFIPYTNLSTRFGIYIKPTLWMPGNNWNFIGDYRFAHYPQYTWGIGGNTKDSDRTLVNSDYLRLYQYALRKISKRWFAGGGFDFDHYYNIKEIDVEGPSHLDHYPVPNTGSSISSGLLFLFVHDTRRNPLNPEKGGYLLSSVRLNYPKLSSNFNQQSFYMDGRKYIPLAKRKYRILCVRGYYWTVISGDTPYLDLPAMGWAPASGLSGRGYSGGRYRSNSMVYGEAEQRIRLTRNGLIGAVFFTSISSVSEFGTQEFAYWHVAGGTGLRVKLNKYSNVNLAVDLGFSKDYWGVWLNIGEAF